MESNDTYLTAKDIMARYKISRSTVHRLRQEGKLAAIKIGPRTIRFPRVATERRLQGFVETR